MAIVNTIGRRKTSVVRIYMCAGTGKISVNGRPLNEYFPLEILQICVRQPLVQLNLLDVYDVKVNACGGGVRGQAEAIRLAIARALCEINIESKPPLKKVGFLTRDPRQVERKKYGQKKARKRFQFTKR